MSLVFLVKSGEQTERENMIFSLRLKYGTAPSKPHTMQPNNSNEQLD
jgi:hypothetical protein